MYCFKLVSMLNGTEAVSVYLLVEINGHCEYYKKVKAVDNVGLIVKRREYLSCRGPTLQEK